VACAPVAPAVPARVQVALLVAPVVLVLAPVVRALVRVVPVVPVVLLVPAARARVVLAVPVVRPWVVHARVVPVVPAVLPVPAARARVVPAVLVDQVEARAQVVAEATAPVVSVVRHARSHVPVVVGTWRSCSRTS
jgi:hypothetical protein